jgi:integrase
VTLSQARAIREKYRALLAQGIDPGEQRKAIKEARADSFEAISLEWYARHAPTWAPAHAKRVKERFDNHVLPYLGDKPITAIGAPMILEVLRRMESVGKLETVHKTKQSIGQVFRYAIATGRAETDPTPSLKGALTPTRPDHFPALLEPAAIGAGCATVGADALRRPGELRTMRWADLALEIGEWLFTLPKTWRRILFR